MRRKQRIENFRRIPEIRCLEPHHGRGKINQPASPGQIEDAQRAGHRETLAPRHRHGFAIIDQQQIGVERLRQRKSRALAPVQSHQKGIGVIRGRGRPQVEPSGWHGGPVAHRFGRFGMKQLVPDRVRDQDFREELEQDFALADQDEIVDRPGIGDDDRHRLSQPEPAQILAVAFEILDLIFNKDAVRLEKSVKRRAGREAK
jgi:hypothetical protein